MAEKHIVIIGAGIVGLATAYKAGLRYPHARVTVLEKESAVGQHQSGNNSGVLHSGLYYQPGSLKARLAVTGIREMTRFCQENGIAHEICGKIVLAVDQSEVPRLKKLHERGTQNGLRGLRWLEPGQIRAIEPHAAGVAALQVPEEGIVDYPKVCEVLAAKITARGDKIVTGAKVSRATRAGPQWILATTAGDFTADLFINCAGLHSDRVCATAGEERTVRIVPFRGEYYKLRPERQHLVRHLIYPVPDPEFPFLGVHFTRLIHGGIEAGPNAVLAFAREGYTKFQLNPRDLFDALAYSGLWNFLRRYPKMCWAELRRSLSKKLFCASLQRLVPEVQPEDLVEGGAGVRAQAMQRDGNLVQDFSFVRRDGALHVLNAPSPAATAALAIAEEILDRAGDPGG